MSQTIADLLPNVDAYHQALTVLEREYLNARGISDAVINRCKLGMCKYNKKLWLTVPILGADGSALQVVLRMHPSSKNEKQRRYELPKDSHAELFGIDLLEDDPDVIVLCEGLLDACAAQSIGLCAISGSAGVDTFRDGWLEHIPKSEKMKKLYICCDRDDPGRKGAQKLLLRISELRSDLNLFNIELPEMTAGKDLTDYLLQCASADKKEALLRLGVPYIAPSPQNRLLDSLSDEVSCTIIPPCQGYMNGKGFVTVTLRHENKLSLFTITSERECFECTEKEWKNHGCLADREPVVDAMPRWDQKQVLAFIRKEDGETFSLADAINYVSDHLKKYLDFADSRCFSIIATWIIMTYCYRLFPAIPYLHLTGLKGAGKTKVMQIISLLAFNGELVTSASSAASITRLVHGNGATLGVDEAETFGSNKDENTATLQDVLRSGYKQGIYVTKCERDSQDRHKVIRLDPFSPKALSGIRGLEDALSTRCIELLMLRTTNAAVANSEIIPSSTEWRDIRAIIYPAVLMTIPAIKYRLENFSVEQFKGRAAELWKPLLLLATAAEHSAVYNDILTFALEQAEQKKDDESDTEIGKLLACIDDLLGSQQKNFIAADDIFTKLIEDDDFSWMTDQKGKGRRKNWLSTRLKRLDLWKGPAYLRSVAGEKKKGYDIEREKLNKAASRLGITLSSMSEADASQKT